MVTGQRPIVTGDLVVALNDMRAWTSDSTRGHSNVYVLKGEQALVLEAWVVGNQQRFRVVRCDRVLMFSCAAHAVHQNWSLPETGFPVTGSR